MRLAIIGGTGVYDPAVLGSVRSRVVDTPYGRVELKAGTLEGEEILFLARHGAGHSLPPHRVNYRANIWALHHLGVERVIATGAVGSLREPMKPGDFVLVDQFIDLTRGRIQTYHEGGSAGVVHLDVTEPYCPELRRLLLDTGRREGIPVHDGGTYACTEGPRFETPAEIRMIGLLGGDLVGMTNVPEVVLARELSLCYCLVAMVTNYAAGIGGERLSHGEVLAVMDENASRLRRLLLSALGNVPRARGCACPEKPEVHGKEATH